MARSAGALPDPMISFGLNGERYPGKMLGEDPMVMGTVMLSQAIPFPGKRGSRRNAAMAAAGVSRAEWSRMRRQLAAEVRRMYADLYALDAMSASLRESQSSLEILEASAASRYTAGLSMQADLIEVQLQRSRVTEQLDDLAAERAAMTSRLNAMLDRVADTPVRTGGLPGLAGALDSLAIARAPDVEVRRLAVETARLRLAVAQRGAWPDLAAGVEYGWRNGLPPMVTATLGVELPVWKSGKQDAEAQAATHDLEMARQDLRMAEAQARGETARLRSARDTAARQVDLYRHEITPRSALLLESARTSYAAGTGGGIREMVDAVRMVLEARAGLARREADLYKAEVALSALAGTDALVSREGGPE
jgi:outer membrane protein, heavy metal efflux system